MGDFVAPAAANGNSPAAMASNGASGIPKHSTVVQRLRQRIEGFRKHHNNCEVRRQQAQAQQIELDRQETLTLHQRCLELKAKKTGKSKQDGAYRNKLCESDPPSALAALPAVTDQRTNTLIAMLKQLATKLHGSVCTNHPSGQYCGQGASELLEKIFSFEFLHKQFLWL